MKRVLVVFLLAALLFNFVPALYAGSPSEKLSRGAANMLTGLLEIPRTIDKEWKAQENAVTGIAWGFYKGLIMGLARTASGAWDVVSFPIPVPDDFGPLYKQGPDHLLKVNLNK